ncbi:MAG: lipid-A-disaccharide synthase [Ignavibacteriaceae bacterium]|nr:lipid-A-disaccharide synthase [Ignavibacteriaceae bacterium]
MNTSKEILIIAGESSGDLHGSALVNSIFKINPGLKISGIGGDLMRESGVNLIYHIKDFNFLGFFEVIKHLPYITKVRDNILEYVRKNKIQNAILIDYPGFNLNIAKKLKKEGVKIFYYISPQLWAWGSGRVKKVKKLIDEMLVVFPFEQDYYIERGVKATYVGHPLLERIKNYEFISKEEFCSKYNLDTEKEILAVLPGSREHEVSLIFPPLIEAAVKIAEKYDMQIVVGCANTIDSGIFKTLSPNSKFTVIKGNNFEIKRYSKFGLVKSGTTTVESAFLGLPVIIVYKTSPITYFIGKSVIQVKNIGMINILSGENTVPELIQNDANPEKIFSTAAELLDDNNKIERIKNKYLEIIEQFGSSTPSETAAKIISEGLK